MTRMEALEMALRLAIVAPNEKRKDEVVLLAETIAAGMTKEEIATVKEEIMFESEDTTNADKFEDLHRMFKIIG